MTAPTITPEERKELYELGFIAALSSDGELQDMGQTIGVGGDQMICIGELLEGWGIKVFGKNEGGTFFVAKCDPETGEAFADIVRGLAIKAAALSAAEARIKRLAAVLVELADDCEAQVEHRYKGIKDHPAMMPKYERDMDTIRRARAALEGEIKCGENDDLEC